MRAPPESFSPITGAPFWIAGSCADSITLREVVELGGQGVQIGTAFALCRDRDMPVVVFDLRVPQNLVGLIQGTVQGTVVSRD